MTAPPLPLSAEALRAAAAALNHGARHGALVNLARLTGVPYRTLQGYALGARPVPRPLAISVRNLIALAAIAQKETRP